MLKRISITALLALLFLSSCKKRVVQDRSLIKDSNRQAEKKDIFSPVSESEAKQFVDLDVRESCDCCVQQINLADGQDLGTIIQLHEAKLSDVPIPLNAEPLKECFSISDSNKKIILGYICDGHSTHMVKFYNDQMERLGWESVASFNGCETLMIFKKPFRTCAISIRMYSHKHNRKQEHTKVIVFTQF